MTTDLHRLAVRAQMALGLTQARFGALLGVSARTGHRWAVGKSVMTEFDLRRLAGHLVKVDRALAKEVANAGRTTLEDLGLVEPVKPFVPSADHVADSVVCVAAETMGVTPGAVRVALAAAFTRAREVGLSVEAMEKALTRSPRVPAAPPPLAKAETGSDSRSPSPAPISGPHRRTPTARSPSSRTVRG
jgi:hypothetical protein